MHVIFDLDSSVYGVGFATQSKTRTAVHKATASILGEVPTGVRIDTWCREGGIDKGTINIEEQIEVEPVGFALHSMNTHFRGIYNEFGGESYEAYLTGKENFRYDIYPDYKKSRKTAPKPVHYDALRLFLQQKFNAVVCEGYEADDACCMAAYKCKREGIPYVIVSRDKDLRANVPGLHYDQVSKRVTLVNSWEVDVNFYTQVLTGDITDDIPGLKGIGPVKSAIILEGCETVDELYHASLKAYEEHYEQDAMQIMHRNAQLLHLLRSIDDKWTPPY